MSDQAFIPTARARPPAFSPRRVGAMVTRYVYLLRSSWARVADLVYWPALQMITWGFLQTYLSRLPHAGTNGTGAMAAGTLIGAILLWDILFRGQIGFSMTFMEEMWSRNLGNLLMSPLRPVEFLLALASMSVLRLAVGIIPVSLLAIWFFGFNLWGLGLALAVFFANLIVTSWSIGLVVAGLLLRNGMGAENVAWTATFLLLPLCGVYYPVSVLPGWLQAVSWLLPPTYVFEGMRHVLIDHVFRADLMLESFALNLLIFGAAAIAFLVLLRSARAAGSLLQMGE
jgi:ABC-2 type transport system permease protein